MSEWISVKDKMPEQDKYVVVRHAKGNWRDDRDQANVSCVVAKMVTGLSLKDRAKLDPTSDRAKSIRCADEWGNNKVPYKFDTFGLSSFFGQDITHWMPLPEPPK